MGLQPAGQLRAFAVGGRALNRPVRPVRIDLPAARLLLCGYGLFALAGARLPSPGCPYRLLTGRRCPACGLTGSVSAALRGRIRHSAAIHRLGPAVAATVLSAGITTVIATVRSAPARSSPLQRDRAPSEVVRG